MVEPEIAENTVPATTATTASRPGTWRIRCSTPSITFTASPVWNSTSPMRMKSGIGVSEKLATDPTELRANWTSPASPPRNSHAPSRLITRKENATGRPRNSSAVEPPLEGPADPIRHCAQDDVHPDVLPAPQQPRRGKHGDEVERAFRDLVAPLEPGDARDDAHVT